MQQLFPILTRLLLFSSIAGIGYIYVARPQNLPAPAQNAANIFISQTDSLANLAAKNPILSKATDKLTQPQSIIEISTTAQVKGVSTDQITQDAKTAIDNTISSVSQELQNLPKKEAAKILRTTCDQIISDLEK